VGEGFFLPARRFGFAFVALAFFCSGFFFGLSLICYLFISVAPVRGGIYFFGLSLICYWFISVAPVRGGTYFLCRRKER
jgi:hypothetical protein